MVWRFFLRLVVRSCFGALIALTAACAPRRRTRPPPAAVPPILVGVGLDAEGVDAGQPVVERALVPEAVLGAADAAVAGLPMGKLTPPFQRVVEQAL